MATASTSKAGGGGGGGDGGAGAGGKFRKKAFRTPATPYSRPPPQSALQAAKDAFKSKLVDPASRVLARTAHTIFSSLFRKRLTAPPILQEPAREQKDEVQEVDTNTMEGPGSGAQTRVSNELAKRSSDSERNGMNEIEEVLRQKTFTRAEVDRLTELLHSKTVTGRADNDIKVPEPTPPRAEAEQDFQYHARLSVQENTVDRQRAFGAISAVAGNLSVVRSNVASPAELAKAYMGDVPLHTSPTNVGPRSQVNRKDVPLLTNTQHTPRSSGVPLENGYSMQRSRGRSAIYHMARTPNTRIHEADIRKSNGYVASSPLQGSWENSKQPLKRRSSILNSDIGSLGSIRRVRQKTNMISPSPKLSSRNGFTNLGSADGSEIAEGSRSVRQKQMFLNGPKDVISNMHRADNGDDSISNLLSVPSRSTQLAEQIMQKLDNSVPSTKEKVSELKLAVAREKPPSKLTNDMLNGKALRSLEHIDSSKMLKDYTFNGLDSSQSRNTQDSPQKQAKFENSHKLIASSNNRLAPIASGERKTIKEDASNSKTPDSANPSFAACPSEQKRAFRMSAHEDFLDLDDDSDNGGVDLPTEKEENGKSAYDTKSNAAEVGTSVNHTVSSETKSPTSTSLSKETANTKENNAATTAEKDGSFTFPVTPTSSTITHLSPATQEPLFSNGVCPPKEATPAPDFGFGSKSPEKAGPFKFSPQSSAVNNSVNPVFGSQSDSKLTQNSSANVPVPVAVSDTPVAIKSDGSENLQKSRDLFGGSKFFVPPAGSTSASMNMFSTGPSKDGANVNNGFFSVPSPLPISAAQVSNGSSEVIFSAATSTSSTAADTSTNSAVSNTAPNSSIAAATPTFPTFKFGPNSVTSPSDSCLLPASTSGTESTNSEQKNKPISPFGSLTSSPVGASSSSGFASSGSGFNFGSSTTSSASNLSPSSSLQSPSSNVFGSSFGSPFGAQGASGQTKTETAPLSHSTPNPFAATALSSTVGQGASSSVSSTGSLFGSTPATSIFGSSSGFGLSSSTSTGGTSFSSSSSTSIFGSSLAPGTSSGTSPGFGTATSTTGFSFGASSAAAANTNTSIFGSSLPSGTSSSTSSGFGTSTSATGFSFGASSVASPNASTNLFGSSTPSGTSSSTNSVFGTPTSTGFSFGASSALTGSTSSIPSVFGSPAPSSNPMFGFTPTAMTPSASVPPSPSVFGTPSPVVQFGSAPQSNNQVNMEDTMAEDTVHASNPVFPTFGQPANTGQPSPFSYGGFGSPAPAPAPLGGSPFQFGSQQNLAAPQNPSPFQAGGNLEFSAGSSFSLGSGGGDKSNRRFVKINRNRTKKK